MYTDLVRLRDALADIAGVNSSKVGIEKNISPAQYPLIRIVPVRITPGTPYKERTLETLIYFGWNLTESAEGLEKVYENLDALEGDIMNVVKSDGGKYIETVTDEDRLDTYKLMSMRIEMNITRPAA